MINLKRIFKDIIRAVLKVFVVMTIILLGIISCLERGRFSPNLAVDAVFKDHHFGGRHIPVVIKNNEKSIPHIVSILLHETRQYNPECATRIAYVLGNVETKSVEVLLDSLLSVRNDELLNLIGVSSYAIRGHNRLEILKNPFFDKLVYRINTHDISSVLMSEYLDLSIIALKNNDHPNSTLKLLKLLNDLNSTNNNIFEIYAYKVVWALGMHNNEQALRFSIAEAYNLSSSQKDYYLKSLILNKNWICADHYLSRLEQLSINSNNLLNYIGCSDPENTLGISECVDDLLLDSVIKVNRDFLNNNIYWCY